MNKIKNYLVTSSPLRKVSDILFVFAVGLSAYTLGITYQAKASGFCPINANRDLFYISIALLMASFIMTFFEKRKKR